MSIGQQLREAREQRSLSLEDAAFATHIRTHYLEALEADDLGIFPSIVQVRGFLRGYARYLQLDPEQLLAEMEVVPALAGSSPVPQPEAPPPVIVEKDTATQQVEAIFEEVGQKLREHREVLGLSLEDVERQTHIRVYYLRALEEGNLQGLPSPVQGRGMLSNYASFLGLDPDPLLLRYADGLQARLAARRSEQKEQSTPASSQVAQRPSTLRRVLSTDLIVGSLLVVFLIAFTAWGTLRISAMRAGNEPTSTSPSIADVLLNSAEETSTSTPSELIVSGPNTSGTPQETSEIELTTPQPTLPLQELVEGVTQTVTATITLPAVGDGPLQVSLIIQQRAWVRVTVDGEVLFNGRVQPGGAYSFSGDDRIEVVAGNGAALRLYFNQQDLGVLGSFGEVIMRVFTIEGVLTPTASLTPTGLPIPTGTPTPQGGPVSTVTPTRSPAATPTLGP